MSPLPAVPPLFTPRAGLGASSALAVFLVLSLPTRPAAAADEAVPVPQAAVAVLNQLSGGPHAGFRANHAKGVLVTGRFTPARGASALTKAPHFNSRQPVPVLVRFSNATGLPTLPDADPNASPHGMAIRFQLPGGASTDIVAISADRFPVATPEDFVGLLQAVATSGADAPSPKPIERFLAAHPLAAQWVATPRPAPPSFANLAFYGINAFQFTNAKCARRFVRYQIVPVDGEAVLTADAAAQAAPSYLMDELPARVARGPVQFKLLAQVAAAGDPVNDGAQAWPADRQRVELGTITLDHTPTEQAAAQKALLFNPLALTAGIAPSADPVLLVRPAAYAISYAQRAR